MIVRTSAPEFDGVLLIDKPTEHTSHDVVARVRGILKMKRVGHAGTLDPMATGLLVVLLGKATKLSQFLMSVDKCYTGSVTLGKITNSTFWSQISSKRTRVKLMLPSAGSATNTCSL